MCLHLIISRDHITWFRCEVSEEEIRGMFDTVGTIVNFRFLTSDRPEKKMALLEFTNTSAAICGLVQFHNKEVIVYTI